MRDIFLSDDTETYTRKQTIQLLNISIYAVINLEKAAVLEKRVYLKGERDVVHYTKESVDRLIERRKNHVLISEIEKQWAIPRNTIQKIASENGIYFFEDETIYLKKVRMISKREEKKLIPYLKKYVAERGNDLKNKSVFMIDKYALLQPFKSTDGRISRLISKKDVLPREFGFYIDNQFIGLREGLSLGFKPMYQVQPGPRLKTNYVEIHGDFQDEATRSFLDECYQQIGYRNLHIQQNNNVLIIYMKECCISIEDTHFLNIGQQRELLKKLTVKKGKISIDNSNIVVKSDYKDQKFKLKESFINELNDLSVHFDKTKSEVIEIALEKLKSETDGENINK